MKKFIVSIAPMLSAVAVFAALEMSSCSYIQSNLPVEVYADNSQQTLTLKNNSSKVFTRNIVTVTADSSFGASGCVLQEKSIWSCKLGSINGGETKTLNYSGSVTSGNGISITDKGDYIPSIVVVK